MVKALYVFIGSGLGGVLRWWISGLIANRFGERFPWGTLLVNISGSFIIGMFYTITGPDGRWLVRDNFKIFFIAGICGGYTTFSSFSLQTLTLAQSGQWLRAGVNVVTSLIFCLCAVWLGHICAVAISK